VKRQFALIALIALACGKKAPGNDSPPSPTPKAAQSIVAPVADPAHLPDASIGWTPCSGPAISAAEAKSKRDAWQAKPKPTTSLKARATTAKREGDLLAIGAGAKSARLGIHAWAKVVLTARADLDTQIESAREWDEFYGGVANALLPRDALVGFVADADWREKSTPAGIGARVYVLADAADAVADAIGKAAPTLLAEAGCAYEQGASHRSQWRFERVDGTAGRRAHLSASPWYGDHGGDANVDIRIIPDVAEGTLVVACFYDADDLTKSCDTFVGSIKR
jgi:hypothetical protein